MRWMILVLAAISLCMAASANAEDVDYTLDFYGGYVFNMKEDLVHRQSNKEKVVIDDAKLKTKPFSMPFYYGFRISRWDELSAWEFEHTHQKLYLDSGQLPDEVQNWEVTDGYNFFLLNRAIESESTGFIYRAGMGVVVTHPDITIYGESNHKRGNGALTYGQGYHFSGFVGQISIQKNYDITERWYVNFEGKLTYAKAWVPIVDGFVEVRNRAFHMNYGVGYRF